MPAASAGSAPFERVGVRREWSGRRVVRTDGLKMICGRVAEELLKQRAKPPSAIQVFGGFIDMFGRLHGVHFDQTIADPSSRKSIVQFNCTIVQLYKL